MTKTKKTKETKQIRVSSETYQALASLAKGFESVDEVIRRLIAAFQGKGTK